MTEGLVFQKRKLKGKTKKFQVRFNMDEAKYLLFKKKVKQEGLYVQDVFEQFIDWFMVHGKKTDAEAGHIGSQ